MYRTLTAAALSAALLAPAAALAGPVRPGWINADAQWMCHLDLDAFRDSKIGAFIIEHREDLDIEFDGMDEVGIDPLTDFYNITAYGVGDPEEDGVIIIQMSDSIDAVIAQAEEDEEADIRVTEVEGRTIYSFDDGDMHGYVHRHESGRRTVVLSAEAGHVLNAIKVIEGDLPDLTDARDPAIRPDPARGAIAYVCAAGARWLPEDENPASQIIRLADGITAQISETDGMARAEVTFSANKTEDAKNIVQIVEGVVALGKLMASQDTENEDIAALRPLIDGVSAEAHDGGIRISLSFPVETLLDMASQAMEEHAADDDHDDEDEDEDDDDRDRRERTRRPSGWDGRR